jgi:hypothetical protein
VKPATALVPSNQRLLHVLPSPHRSCWASACRSSGEIPTTSCQPQVHWRGAASLSLRVLPGMLHAPCLHCMHRPHGTAPPVNPRSPHTHTPGSRYLLFGSDEAAVQRQFLEFFSRDDWDAHSALQVCCCGSARARVWVCVGGGGGARLAGWLAGGRLLVVLCVCVRAPSTVVQPRHAHPPLPPPTPSHPPHSQPHHRRLRWRRCVRTSRPAGWRNRCHWRTRPSATCAPRCGRRLWSCAGSPCRTTWTGAGRAVACWCWASGGWSTALCVCVCVVGWTGSAVAARASAAQLAAPPRC